MEWPDSGGRELERICQESRRDVFLVSPLHNQSLTAVKINTTEMTKSQIAIKIEKTTETVSL